MKILSLGAGVQSSTVLMMSIRGELPRLDAAIFADTQWEPKAVYRHLEWLKVQAAKAGIPLHVVSVGNLRDDAIHFQRTHKPNANGVYASLPLFITNLDGTKGMLRRQCTERYKLRPIGQKIRKLIGLAKGQRSKKILCEQWIGISVDEARRARRSPLYPWMVNRYPLIDKQMSRADCKIWMRKYYPHIDVPRSACIGCPYHNDKEWQTLKTESPEEFQDAVQFEKDIQRASTEATWNRRLLGTPYLNSRRQDLDTIDFRAKEDH